MVYDLPAAWSDIVRSARDRQLWGRLGWMEVKRRYRRTVIGPFWTAISVAALVITLGSLWSGLWGESAQDYLPYLCSGLVVWMMVATMISEGCTAFISATPLLRQLNFTYTVLVYALLWRNLIVFGHNFTVFIVVALFTNVSVTSASWLVFPGLALLMINGFWISTLLGLLSMRFRDVPQLINILLQIAIFLTPIFWTPDRLTGARRLLVDFNPLHHMISVVRSPLLGQVPDPVNYMASVIMAVGGMALTLVLFSRFRSRLAYWA